MKQCALHVDIVQGVKIIFQPNTYIPVNVFEESGRTPGIQMRIIRTLYM